MLKRNEWAHANSVESFPLLFCALGFASMAGVPPQDINRAGLVYTVARVCYDNAYILIEDGWWAVSRGVLWWVGNASCLWLLWEAGKLFTSER